MSVIIAGPSPTGPKSMSGTSNVPPASSPHASATMKANKSTDTSLEIKMRSALHRAGMRFFKNQLVGESVRTRVDIVFPRARVAVFVDGCFWHYCPEHGQLPAANREFWRAKLEGNRSRDHLVNGQLEKEGWTVIRIWEHERIERGVARVESALELSRAGSTRSP